MIYASFAHAPRGAGRLAGFRAGRLVGLRFASLGVGCLWAAVGRGTVVLERWVLSAPAAGFGLLGGGVGFRAGFGVGAGFFAAAGDGRGVGVSTWTGAVGCGTGCGVGVGAGALRTSSYYRGGSRTHRCRRRLRHQRGLRRRHWRGLY